MAILSKTPAKEDGIPPMLQRTNGKANDTEALLARIAQLEAQVARKSTLTLKVSEKGAVSLYGLGRFPVSLYAERHRLRFQVETGFNAELVHLRRRRRADAEELGDR